MPLPDRGPAIIAHRGAARQAPGNTCAAFARAIDMGADVLEMDVRTTRDGRLVVVHDPTVAGPDGAAAAVAELASDELRALDVGARFSAEFAGERVPFLEEALEVCRGRAAAYVELKAADADRVLDTARRMGLLPDVLLQANLATLHAVRRAHPGVALHPSPGAALRDEAALATLLQSLRPAAVNSHLRHWTRRAAEMVHAFGARVYPTTLGEATDDLASMGAALALGADGIETDRIDVLSALRSRTN